MARKGGYRKYQEIENEDGWTHVVKGPRLASTELNRPGKASKHDQLKETKSILSIDDIRRKYEKTQSRWANESRWSSFEQIFEERIASSDDVSVNQAMVLGLGSVAADNLDSCAMDQLVLFEHWLSFLRTRFTIDKVYLQDPQFHANDCIFLEELGTFLYTPCLPWMVTYTLFYAAYPCLMVGNDLDMARLSSESRALLEETVVKEFYNSRDSVSLDPGQKRSSGMGKHVQWLQNLVIFWPSNSQLEQDSIKADQNLNVSRPKESSKGNEQDLDSSAGRVGPGQWQSGKGFVFDEEFRQKLERLSL